MSLATWQSWLEAIKQDIHLLHADRAHWRELVKIARGNPRIPSPGYILGWITRMYVSHVSSGIRRQMEESPKVVSLRRLLGSISRHPTILTRDAFVKAWCASDPNDDFEVSMATAGFDDYAAPGTDHVDRALIRKDLDLLVSTGDKIKAYVDERVAHLNKAHADADEFTKLAAPTYRELDDALSLLGTLLQKYHLLLTGNALASAEPVLQYNWTLPLTVAWLSSEDD